MGQKRKIKKAEKAKAQVEERLLSLFKRGAWGEFLTVFFRLHAKAEASPLFDQVRQAFDAALWDCLKRGDLAAGRQILDGALRGAPSLAGRPRVSLFRAAEALMKDRDEEALALLEPLRSGAFPDVPGEVVERLYGLARRFTPGGEERPSPASSPKTASDPPSQEGKPSADPVLDSEMKRLRKLFQAAQALAGGFLPPRLKALHGEMDGWVRDMALSEEGRVLMGRAIQLIRCLEQLRPALKSAERLLGRKDMAGVTEVLAGFEEPFRELIPGPGKATHPLLELLRHLIRSLVHDFMASVHSSGGPDLLKRVLLCSPALLLAGVLPVPETGAAFSEDLRDRRQAEEALRKKDYPALLKALERRSWRLREDPEAQALVWAMELRTLFVQSTGADDPECLPEGPPGDPYFKKLLGFARETGLRKALSPGQLNDLIQFFRGRLLTGLEVFPLTHSAGEAAAFLSSTLPADRDLGALAYLSLLMMGDSARARKFEPGESAGKIDPRTVLPVLKSLPFNEVGRTRSVLKALQPLVAGEAWPRMRETLSRDLRTWVLMEWEDIEGGLFLAGPVPPEVRGGFRRHLQSLIDALDSFLGRSAEFEAVRIMARCYGRGGEPTVEDLAAYLREFTDLSHAAALLDMLIGAGLIGRSGDPGTAFSQVMAALIGRIDERWSLWQRYVRILLAEFDDMDLTLALQRKLKGLLVELSPGDGNRGRIEAVKRLVDRWIADHRRERDPFRELKKWIPKPGPVRKKKRVDRSGPSGRARASQLDFPFMKGEDDGSDSSL